jgi:hypothetical protein
VPTWDPTCSVRACSRPSDGVLTVATAQGSLQLGVCEPHGQRVGAGEWFTFTLLGSDYLLGPSAVDMAPARYEPLQC